MNLLDGNASVCSESFAHFHYHRGQWWPGDYRLICPEAQIIDQCQLLQQAALQPRLVASDLVSGTRGTRASAPALTAAMSGSAAAT